MEDMLILKVETFILILQHKDVMKEHIMEI